MVHHDWIPVEQLLAIYPSVDFFISFPGNPTAIRSKVYDYMSYGKPIMLLYEDDQDVNVQTFSRYPASLSLDVRELANKNLYILERFFSESLGKEIPFETTEALFPDDSAKAYVSLIGKLLSARSE